MDLMKKRWAVLVASVIVNICIGTGFAWSVYQTGLFNEGAVIFEQRCEVAAGPGIYNLQRCGAHSHDCGQRTSKKLKGPRNVVWLGGILFSADSYAPALSTA